MERDFPGLLLLKGRIENNIGSQQRSEVRSQKSEVRSQRSEVRGQKSEVRSQRSEVRGQKSEVRGLQTSRALTKIWLASCLDPPGNEGEFL
jgi:hypothetical protein